MNTVGNPLLWGVFIAIVVIMLAIDLFMGRTDKARPFTTKQAAIWSLIWVAISLLFAAFIMIYLEPSLGAAAAEDKAEAFLTGYLLEKTLAIDNVFVWLMIFNYFAVPPLYQRRVLIYGVLGAIVLRTVMIIAGGWLITRFEWLLYVFGVFLLFTGIKMAIPNKKESSPLAASQSLVSWLSRHLRLTDGLEGQHFFIRRQGLLFATPLLLTLILVELSDVVFALDSIPAIFAVTTDPFIALTSNLFAILGLRAMFFLLANMAERFSLLKYGLGIVLTFIGVKMLIVDFYPIPVSASLIVVVLVLSLTLLLNVWVNHKNNKKN